MFREWVLSKEVHDVKSAEWEGYKKMAAALSDHHVLSVQLIRTRHNETAAVLVLVRDGQPVQQVVFADERGRVFPGQGKPQDDGSKPRSDDGSKPRVQTEALVAQAASGPPVPMSLDGGGGASPDGMALGQPPISEPPSAAALAIASAALPTVMDLGESAASSGV